MRHFILAAIFAACASSTSAQTRIAIRGSYNHSSAAVKSGTNKLDNGFISTGGLGLYFKAPFDGVLHFSPYAALNGRGYSFAPATGTTTNIQANLYYLDLVPAVSIDVPTGNANHWVVSVGPNFSLGLLGREKRTTNGTTTTSNIKFSNTAGYGLYDIGLNTAIGYHTRKWFVELGYQHGLASINNEEEFDNINIRNRVLSLNLGYYLK